ncbi:MAG: hypothetical protein R3F65_05520 [bacterium]
MRRLLGGALLLTTLAALGCGQEDPDPEPREEGSDGGGGYGGIPLNELPTDPPTPPPENVFNDFGGECSPPDGCDNMAANWPDCLDEQCSTGDCTFPGLANDYGYCTRNCTRDDECENAAPSGPYGQSFRCLTDGTSGTCVPGSAQRCDLRRNGQCDIEGEVCKWGLIYAPDQNYGGTCQPATEGGRDVGESCDEEQGINCANDLCLFDTCTSLCDPNAPAAQSPCPDNWTCFRDFDIGVTLDVCLPAYCETDSDCSNGFTCVLAFEFNSETVLRGICLKSDEGQAQPGEDCTEERPCQAAACLDDEDGTGFCAGLCDTDADCGPGAFCDIINFGITAEPGVAPAQVCFPGERTGSGRPCDVDSDCAADEANPEEACEYFVDGQLEAGRFVSPPELSGRCSEIKANSVGFGETCNDARPCRTESLCLSAGNSSFCSAACRGSRDCDGGMCFAIDFGGGRGGVCVPPDVLGAEGASLTPCMNDAACPGAERCQLNFIDADNPVAELLCLPAGGRGAAGADCNAANQCASGDCAPRSNDATVPGYCRAPCADDDDCGAGFTCEAVRPGVGSNRVNLCRPTDACAPCTFDGTAPCGGDTVCGLVGFGNRGDAGACLAACEGPDDVSCDEGFSCQAVINGAGEATADYACTPLRAEQVCADAAPAAN